MLQTGVLDNGADMFFDVFLLCPYHHLKRQKSYRLFPSCIWKSTKSCLEELYSASHKDPLAGKNG